MLTPSYWDRLRLDETNPKHKAGCELALLFWSPSPWTAETHTKWVSLLRDIYAPARLPRNRATGEIITEVTSTVLCNALRHALHGD